MGTLKDLLTAEEMTRLEFLEAYALEACVPGICKNKNCMETYEYEPDQTEGWCDECQTNTVVSGLVLMGVI